MMRKFMLFILFSVFASGVFSGELSFVSQNEVEHLVANWVIFVNKIPFGSKIGEYSIKSVERIQHRGILVGEIYHLYPRGHFVISALRELTPVKSFSLTTDFDSKSLGYESMVVNDLKEALGFLIDYRNGKNWQVERALEENYREWDELVKMDFKEGIPLKEKRFTQIGKIEKRCFRWQNSLGVDWITILVSPLIRTRWDQDWPFNAQCPEIANQRTLVGCVATAASQLARYYQWPKKGKNEHSYEWRSKILRADFSDKYDWQFMPSTTAKYDTQKERDAVSELCYEMGVAVEMNFGLSGSGAYTRDVASALKKYFIYKKNIKVVERDPSYMDEDEWFRIFKREIDRKRPVVFRIKSSDAGHAVLADGYLITKNGKSSVSRKVHINMGWRGSMDAFYSLNKIYDFRRNRAQYAIIRIVPRHAFVLASPSRKQQVQRGTRFRITWSSWGCSPSVKIMLYKGTEFIETIKAKTANDGMYLWNVPDDLQEGSGYRIRILDAEKPNYDYWGDFFVID